MERRPSQIYKVEWPIASGEVVVLDSDLRVLVGNHGSEDLWGVRQGVDSDEGVRGVIVVVEPQPDGASAGESG